MRGANCAFAVVCLLVQEQLSAANEQTALFRKENNALSTTTQLLVILRRPHVSRPFPLRARPLPQCRGRAAADCCAEVRSAFCCRRSGSSSPRCACGRSKRISRRTLKSSVPRTRKPRLVLRRTFSPMLCPPCPSRPLMHSLITPTPRVQCYRLRVRALCAARTEAYCSNGVACSNGGRRRRRGWKRR